MSEKTIRAYSGGFRELILLFLPISVTTFSTCLFLLVEKLFLASLSPDLMEAAISASFVMQIFQGPCVAIAMMAQVCIGRWRGAQDLNIIGPGTWQFIWFSFLSMLVTTPLSLIYGSFYFKGTEIDAVVWPYYYFLVAINFLYPLGATLSCFYLGQGKTKLVLWGTLGSQLVKLILSYAFIFGLNGWIPAMGMLGGPMSTLVAQGGFCLLLFWFFLNPKQENYFNSRACHFQPKLFWECTYPGLLRALARVISFVIWASIAHLMTEKGGDYLLILSIGGSLSLFLPFLGDAICQAQTIVVSHLLGSRSYHLLNKAYHSGTILVAITIVILAVPLIAFPDLTFKLLFPAVVLDSAVISKVFLGVWASFAFFTFYFVPISYILAFKDTKFSVFMGLFNWINGYLLMYAAIVIFAIEADQFWLVLSLMHASSALLYLWRMKWLQRQFIPFIKINGI